MTIIDEPIAPPRVKRWTKAEFYSLDEQGMFDGQRVVLHRGELIEMAKMGRLHAIGVMNVSDWLYSTYRSDHRIRIQLPLEVPGETVPLPDGVVVKAEQAFREPHPNAAILVIEVADSSLELDRDMVFDYAAAGIPEYWILNMRGRSLEVFREPVADAATATGFRFAWHRVVTETESFAPLARPDSPVAVSTLLAAR
jgi:Uma2 family endonuclease